MAAIATGVLASSACGGPEGNPDADPVRAAPRTAPFYAELTLGGRRGDRLRAALARLGASASAIDRGARSSRSVLFGKRIDIERDIAPWVGDRVGLSYGKLRTGYTLIGAVRDRAKADSALKRWIGDKSLGQHRGVSLRGGRYAWARFSDLAMVGTAGEVRKAVDAVKDGGLAGTASYRAAAREASKDRVGEVYADVAGLISAVGRTPSILGEGEDVRRKLADLDTTAGMASLAVRDGALAVENSVQVDVLQRFAFQPRGAARQGSPLFAKLPAGPAAFAFSEFGSLFADIAKSPAELDVTPAQLATARRQYRQLTGQGIDESLRSVGDVAVAIRRGRGTPLGVGALLELKSDAGYTALRRLAVRARDAGERVRVAGSRISLRIAGTPGTFALAKSGRTLAIAYGLDADEVLDPQVPITRDPSYRRVARSLRGGYTPLYYASISNTVRVIRDLLPLRYRALASGVPRKVGAIAQGERRRGERSQFRTVVVPAD